MLEIRDILDRLLSEIGGWGYYEENACVQNMDVGIITK